MIWYTHMYLLTAIGLTPGGSSTVHIYTTQTVHRTTQNKQYIEEHNNLWECGPCPVLARFTLAFALQLRKKHWLLFIHKILFFSTCFEPQVLIIRRIQLYTCSIWYCHCLREFVVACRYTAWAKEDVVIAAVEWERWTSSCNIAR